MSRKARLVWLGNKLTPNLPESDKVTPQDWHGRKA